MFFPSSKTVTKLHILIVLDVFILFFSCLRQRNFQTYNLNQEWLYKRFSKGKLFRKLGASIGIRTCDPWKRGRDTGQYATENPRLFMYSRLNFARIRF